MINVQPKRLRADTSLPRALREALSELPHDAPDPARLDELRQRLGLNMARAEAPGPRVLLSERRPRLEKERRLRRTVIALLFLPAAATAAAGAALDLGQRLVAPHAVAARSSAAPASNRASRSAVVASPPPVFSTPEVPPSEAPASSAATGAARSFANHSASGVAEVALLSRANLALKSDPAQALSLTAQHRQQFPTGNLAQERDVIAIEALLALGEIERARQSLARFEATYPRSAHVLELRQIVDR